MIWATNKSFVQWLPLTPYVLKQTNTSSNKNRNLLSFTNSTHMFGQHSETLVLFAVNSPCCPHVSMNVFQSSYPTAFILVVKASAACSKLKPIFESGSEDMLIACQCLWPWHQQTTRRQKLFLTQDLNEGGGQPKTKHELNIATGQSQFNDRVAPRGDTLQGCWRLMLIWASLKYWFSITWSGCRRRRSRTWFIWKFEFPRPHWCFSRSVWW